jgi:hypothetical protein
VTNGNSGGAGGSSPAGLRSSLLALCERLLKMETTIWPAAPPSSSELRGTALTRDQWFTATVSLRVAEQQLAQVRRTLEAMKPDGVVSDPTPTSKSAPHN